jgi:hypothetical protein
MINNNIVFTQNVIKTLIYCVFGIWKCLIQVDFISYG